MEEDEDWFESEVIDCPACSQKLEMIEHSSFEDGYYLYCSLCPNRVDVSVYDDMFEKLEEQLKLKYPALEDKDEDKFLDILLEDIEKNLSNCRCGGKYSDKSKRRCLHCHEILENYDSSINVWLVGSFDDDDVDNKMRKYILEPIWKTNG